MIVRSLTLQPNPPEIMLSGSVDEVKNEPMLFNCSVLSARRLGGPITQEFLSRLPSYVPANAVVDTRVSMLMPGWYPCIPGWHHDDVPRTRSDGQPDYLKPGYKSKHIAAIVGDDVSRTWFATGTAEFSEPGLGEVISKIHHREVRAAIALKKLRAWRAPMGALIEFDWNTWHRGERSRGSGWRWWGRISWDTDRASRCTNEVRRQVQVYIPRPKLNAGW